MMNGSKGQPIPNDLISITQAAQVAGRTTNTIRSWYRYGWIKKYRRGPREILVSKRDVERMVEIGIEAPRAPRDDPWDGLEVASVDGPPTIGLPALRS